VWDTELLESLELPRRLFPLPKASTELDGTLSRESAVLLGLTEGIPVSVGGGDAACATRGAGVLGTRQAYGAIGSSAWISTLSEAPVPDNRMRMQHFLDLEGRLYNVCGTVQSAGIALDWIRHLLGETPSGTSESYGVSEELLRTIPIGSSGVLFIPYLMGERTPYWDASARGAYIGLSLSTDKKTLLRATYEGVAFALRDCMKVYGELGIDIRSFTLLGGGVRSPFWQEIIGETLGIPLYRHPYPTQATALGAALAAGVAVGLWNHIPEAIAKTTQEYEQVLLDHNRVRSYDKTYQVYERVYPSLKSIYRDLDTIRNTIVEERKKEVFI
jgi:xylulokinase